MAPCLAAKSMRSHFFRDLVDVGIDRVLETMRSQSNAPWAKTLASAVRAQRQGLGLTQVELADIAAVGLAFLYELEHGKATVRMDKVIAVLGALGLELQIGQGTRGVVADIGDGVP